MQDPALYNLLNSSVSHDEYLSSFDDALEKSIKEQVDLLMKDQDPSSYQLLSESSRRQKIEEEVRENLNCSEMGELIAQAVKILGDDGRAYLDKECYERLISEIDQMKKKIEGLEFEQLDDNTVQAAFSIPENSCDQIFKISISKFNEGLLSESLALFAFLSALNREDADSAYRLGIAAQKNERYELALKAFKSASELDPGLIGPRLFASQCYLSINQLEKAIQALNEAKNIAKTNLDEEWKALIQDMENLIHH